MEIDCRKAKIFMLNNKNTNMSPILTHGDWELQRCR